MAIGDVLFTIAVPGIPSATFSFASDPSGYFGISGSNIVLAVNMAPDGDYPIELTANSIDGVPIWMHPFVLTFIGAPPVGGLVDVLGNSLADASGNQLVDALGD